MSRWNPDAIVFNSSHLYGTPSYWMQRFFTESSGSTVLDTTLQTSPSSSLVASAISWKSSVDDNDYIRIKVLILKLMHFIRIIHALLSNNKSVLVVF